MGVKKLLKFLPKKLRHSVFRESLSLPWNLDLNIQFKFVTDQAEFLAALRVLHDGYVGKSFMKPDPLKIRLTPHHLMPSTMMAIAKINGVVVATMSLIRDNPIGLPMEKIFDLSQLRTRGEVLCEFSSLAISPEYRGNGGHLLHSFFRFFYRYIRTWCGVDHFVVAVNPSMAELYEAFYLFRPFQALSLAPSYQFVNGAPAVPLFLPLSDFEADLKKTYLKKTLRKNLFYFLQSSNANSDLYPCPEYFQVRSTIITPSFIQELREAIPDLDSRFPEEINLRIAQSLGANTFSEIGKGLLPENLRIQMNTATRICLKDKSDSALARVCDVSRGGVKLFIGPNQQLREGAQSIKIKLGPNITSKVVVRPAWHNPEGYAGVSLLSADQEWIRFTNRFREDENSLAERSRRTG